MDREMLLAYQRRWQAVAQMEQAERQAATVAQRWQQLNSLLRLSATLGLQPKNEDSATDPAQERWKRLKSLYLAHRQEALL